jgi:SET domain-containing protein
LGKQHYKPLPECLTIKESAIEGLGLYATQKIDAGVNLGITHIKDERFENGYSRTPLGGFFNHSDAPNCEVIYDEEYIYLKTLVELEPGTELTVTYTFYNPEIQD